MWDRKSALNPKPKNLNPKGLGHLGVNRTSRSLEDLENSGIIATSRMFPTMRRLFLGGTL